MTTRYELLERIGAGGMAEIFRGKAVAAGGFEKPVAIKRILPHLSQDGRFVELLIAEAKILSQLRHRNIVQIFDVGLGDDGQYFLVMEFVDGMDLGAVQRGLEPRRKRLPLDLVLHIGAEVCEALEHAHRAAGPDGAPMRLVHRDVSPSNVLVSRAGEVKLTDFGIAKRPEEHTGHGTVRGKFAYISPEQAANRHVDGRSDVFSLGLLLMELASGRRVFSHMKDLDALRAVRDGKVPRLRDLDPDSPREVEETLAAALAHDPDQRVAGAAELGARLRTIRYGLDSAAGDPSKELAGLIGELAGAKTPAPAPTALGKRSRVASTFDGGEPTVVRISTAVGFSDEDGTAILHARQILERFEEEEETRLGTAAPPGPWDDEAPTGAHGDDPDPGSLPITPPAPAADDDLEAETRILAAKRGETGGPALALLARGKRARQLPPPRTAARTAAERAERGSRGNDPADGLVPPSGLGGAPAGPPMVSASGSGAGRPPARAPAAAAVRGDPSRPVTAMPTGELEHRRRRMWFLIAAIGGSIAVVGTIAAIFGGARPTVPTHSAAAVDAAVDAAPPPPDAAAAAPAAGKGSGSGSGSGSATHPHHRRTHRTHRTHR